MKIFKTLYLVLMVLVFAMPTFADVIATPEQGKVLDELVQGGNSERAAIMSGGVYKDYRVFKDGGNFTAVFEFTTLDTSVITDQNVKNKVVDNLKTEATTGSMKVHFDAGLIMKFIYKKSDGTILLSFNVSKDDFKVAGSVAPAPVAMPAPVTPPAPVVAPAPVTVPTTGTVSAEQSNFLDAMVAAGNAERDTVLKSGVFTNLSVRRDGTNFGIVYEYNIAAAHDQAVSQHTAGMKASVVSTLKTLPAFPTLQSAYAQGLAMTYTYKKSDGSVLVSFVIDKKDF